MYKHSTSSLTDPTLSCRPEEPGNEVLLCPNCRQRQHHHGHNALQHPHSLSFLGRASTIAFTLGSKGFAFLESFAINLVCHFPRVVMDGVCVRVSTSRTADLHCPRCPQGTASAARPLPCPFVRVPTSSKLLLDTKIDHGLPPPCINPNGCVVARTEKLTQVQLWWPQMFDISKDLIRYGTTTTKWMHRPSPIVLPSTQALLPYFFNWG